MRPVERKKPLARENHISERAGRVNITKEMFGSNFTRTRPDSCGPHNAIVSSANGFTLPSGAIVASGTGKISNETHTEPTKTVSCTVFVGSVWPTQLYGETARRKRALDLAQHSTVNNISLDECFIVSIANVGHTWLKLLVWLGKIKVTFQSSKTKFVVKLIDALRLFCPRHSNY